MTLSYRGHQVWNLVYKRFARPSSLRWAYIYGHYRGGTSYAHRQLLRTSRCGTGDWMLYQFADAFLQADQREKNRTFNVGQLYRSLRQNILASSPPGGGNHFDIVVKQAGAPDISEVHTEVEFLSQVFGAPPACQLFLFREPHGWWKSAKLKFGLTNEKLSQDYVSAFEMYERIGGTALEYCGSLPGILKTYDFMKGIAIDPFAAKDLTSIEDAKPLEAVYQGFIEKTAETKALDTGREAA